VPAQTRCPNFAGAVCPSVCALVVVADAGNAGGEGEGEGEGNAGEGEGEGEGVVDAGPRPDPNAPTLTSPAVPAQTSHGEAVDVSLTALAADLDVGDTISFVVVAPPLHGSASASVDGVSYTPNPGFAGFDSIGVA